MAIAISKTVNEETIEREFLTRVSASTLDPAEWYIYSRASSPAVVSEIAALRQAGLQIRYWNVSDTSVSAMSAAERLVVDELLLAARKRIARRYVIERFGTFFESRYAPFEVIVFGAVGPTSSPARIAAVNNWRDWTLTVAGAARVLIQRVNQTTVGSDPLDVVRDFNFEALRQSDPRLTIPGAMAL